MVCGHGLAGVVGFDTYFGTTKSFDDAGTDELFSIIQRCKLPYLLVSCMQCYVARTCNSCFPGVLLGTHLFMSACFLQRGPLHASTGFRELYCRAVNPARELMLWDADVRGAPALVAAFRARMAQLLREVCCCCLLPLAHGVNFILPHPCSLSA